MNPSKLPFDIKLAFGVGQVAEGVMRMALATFLMFYYNQVLGLSGALAGTAVGFAVIVDGFTDPLMGSLSDHWRAKQLGRRHPFMYVSILPLAISFYLLFNPLVSSQTGLFIWLMVFANATRTSMSLYNIPHMALGAEITDDYRERSALASFRVFFEKSGWMLCFVVGFGIFFASTPELPNGQLNVAAYPPFALMLSLLMGTVIFWSAWGTRSVIPFLPKPHQSPRIGILRTIVRVFTDLFGSLRNRSFRWLFGGMLTVYVVGGVNEALNLYMYSYFWELSSGDILMLLVANPVGVMVGALFSTRFFMRWDKRTGLIFGTLSWAFWQTLPVVLRLLGFFPENDDAWLLPLLVGMRAIQGICVAQADVGYGALVPDVVDEHELERGKRQEGIFFAASYFAAKATSGFGVIIAGFALDLISWPRGAHIQTAAQIPAETIFELGVFYGPMLATFGFLSFWCFTRCENAMRRFCSSSASVDPETLPKRGAIWVRLPRSSWSGGHDMSVPMSTANLSIEGKIAVITGGGTGIGKGIALEFAKAGADVAISGRRPGPLEETAK